MAKLQCQLHWDPKAGKVVKTYRVLSTGPKDTIQFVTSDSEPFIIQTNKAQLAKKLGLEKAPGANGQNLWEVKKVTAPPKKAASAKKAAAQKATPPPRLPAWLKLKCGTLNGGHFVSWGGVGPLGFNDDY